VIPASRGAAAAVVGLALALFAAPAAIADDTQPPRIVGGTTTTIEQWPWQVAVAASPDVVPGNGYQRQFCGGSLVAPTVVVTAAHCVYDFGVDADDCSEAGEGFNFPAGDFSAITGRTRLSSSQGQEIAVAELYYFAAGSGGQPTAVAQSTAGSNGLYSCETSAWDVALLQLASPSSSSAIHVAGPDEAAVWTAGSTAYITGWGDLAENAGNYPDDLQAGQVQIVADSTCGSSGVYGATFISSVMLCAGNYPQGGVDTCQGDSGGPLVVPAEIGSGLGYRLVGDTSFGLGCARPGFPGIYGRLAGEPIRGAVGTAVAQIGGVDPIGSGARPIAAPETSITKHPKRRVKTRKSKVKATFAFGASEPASFQCQLDKAAARPCSSPYTKRVKRGRHAFSVTAIDALQAADPIPATWEWRVKRRRGKAVR
jgi:hypothetical protein